MKFIITLGEDTATTDLKRKLGVFGNPRHALEAAALAFGSLALRSFTDSSVRALPWAPLKPGTIAAKKRKGQPTAKLQATTALINSVSSMTNTFTDSSVSMAVSVPYAGYHQTGTSKMPARPIFPVTEDGELTPKASDVMWKAVKRAMNADLKGSL